MEQDSGTGIVGGPGNPGDADERFIIKINYIARSRGFNDERMFSGLDII